MAIYSMAVAPGPAASAISHNHLYRRKIKSSSFRRCSACVKAACQYHDSRPIQGHYPMLESSRGEPIHDAVERK